MKTQLLYDDAGNPPSAAMLQALARVESNNVMVISADPHKRRRTFRPGMAGLAMLAAMGGLGFHEMRESELRRELNQLDYDRLLAAKIKRERKALKKGIK